MKPNIKGSHLTNKFSPLLAAEKGLDYIGLSVVFFCTDGKAHLLLAQRSQNCRDEQGRWDVGGGAVEFGNSVIETLKKELHEEYGTFPLEYQFLGYRDVQRLLNGRLSHWLALDFKVVLDPDEVKIGEPEKIDQLAWFTLKNLPSPLHSQLSKALEKYQNELFTHDEAVKSPGP